MLHTVHFGNGQLVGLPGCAELPYADCYSSIVTFISPTLPIAWVAGRARTVGHPSESAVDAQDCRLTVTYWP